MGRRPEGSSTIKLVATYAAVSLIPVLALGLVLAVTFRGEAQSRAMTQGRSEGVLVAHSAVEPQLDGRPLSQGLSPTERAAMHAIVKRTKAHHEILSLRVLSLQGRVMYSDGPSGFSQPPHQVVTNAAHGSIGTLLTTLPATSARSGSTGPQAVAVFVPLRAESSPRRVGVLEVDLAYARIETNVTAELHDLYLDLGVGLTILYLVLLVISMSVSGKLRQQLRLNTFLAEHDSLTGLENRGAFYRRLSHVVEETGHEGGAAAVALIDLDRFKEVNDTLGHHNGDRLIVELSRRLQHVLRPQDSVARVGGDEFGVIVRDVADPTVVLWRLRNAIAHELSIDGFPLSVDSSIGYVVTPAQGTQVDELLAMADVALYAAKEQHAGVLRYHSAQHHYDPFRLSLVGQFRQAIEANQLVAYYQPKVRVSDGQVDSVEALVRWQHPSHGLLGPDVFVPLVEQTDLIERMTGWVLTRALSDLRALGQAGESLKVSVNVSARNLARPGFADRVAVTLQRVGVEADRLVIELTETALVTDPARAASTLGELSALGVGVSIDDFGIGQTSLGYLSTLPVDELKIDRSFVADVAAHRAHQAIVRSIIELGHNLGLKVVAEGVETTEVLSVLQVMDCDSAQGYLFARPMPARTLGQWLTATPDQAVSASVR